MRVMILTEIWNVDDSYLVVNNSITDEGLRKFWSSIDIALKFNHLKREAFLHKIVAQNLNKHQVTECASAATGKSENKVHDANLQKYREEHRRNDIPNFFQRRKQVQHDKFHWSARETNNKENHQQFILPKPKYINAKL